MKELPTIRKMFKNEFVNIESIRRSAKSDEALDHIIKADDEIRNKLADKPELMKLYENVTNAFDESEYYASEQHYVEGFKFGFLLAMDILDNN